METHLKEKILISAANLFYLRGVNRVSVNEVANSSGVSKMTLYKYFSSKDCLVQEVAKYRSEQWINWFELSMNQLTGDPEDKLLSIFDIMAEWFSQNMFEKCPFSTMAAEIGKSNSIAYKACLEPANITHKHIAALVESAGISSVEDFADQITLLLSGAILIANLNGQHEGIKALNRGRENLSVLIKHYASAQILH